MSKQTTIIHALTQRAGAQILTIEAITDARLKKGAPWKKVLKKASVNGILGIDYEKAVNKRLIAAQEPAKFIAQRRRWGDHIEGTPLITYGGKVYLDFVVMKNLSATYYEPEGSVISLDRVKPFLYDARSQLVVVRNYDINHLTKIIIGGHTYEFD